MEALPELVIYCDAAAGKFTLRVSGGTISHAFATTEEAIRHAETLVEEETKLTIFDVAGKPLIITTVLPQEN